jgi:hypothetical protein
MYLQDLGAEHRAVESLGIPTLASKKGFLY